MMPPDMAESLKSLAAQLKDDELLLRLRDSEDNFVERKTANDKGGWLKTAVAFANSVPIGYPSVLFVGVSDKGEVQLPPDTNLESLQKTVSDSLKAAYPPLYYLPKVLTADLKPFLAVIIPGSPDRPHFAGKSYVRVGPETREASEEQFESLVAQRQSKVYEISKWLNRTIILEHRQGFGHNIQVGGTTATLLRCNAFYVTQDFHFGPGTVKVYTRAAPKTTSFRAEPCTSPPAAGPKARPSAHRR